MNVETSSEADDAGVVTVLIADDDVRVRHALRALIEADPGIEVIGEAGNAAEVLAYESRLAPMVVLLDLVMPDADNGLWLLRQLARERGRPVVAISIRGSLRSAALEAGALAFVEKGASPDALLGALRGVATNGRLAAHKSLC